MGLETILSVLASSGGNGGRPTSLEEAATQLQCHMEETVAHDWQLADMARRGTNKDCVNVARRSRGSGYRMIAKGDRGVATDLDFYVLW